MKIKLLLLSVLLLVTGCSPAKEIVYIDSASGKLVQPIKRMKQIDVPIHLVCIMNRQYYKFYDSPSAVFIPRYVDGWSLPVYCDEKTLFDGTQGK